MVSALEHDAAAFEALAPGWDALARQAEAGLFLSHAWLSAWWSAYRGVDELWALTLRDGERLVAAWPLHLRAPHAGALRVAELRLLGDLGGAQRSVLARAEDLDLAAAAFVDTLKATRGWDLLEVPVAGRPVAEALERAARARGMKSDRDEVPGRARVELPPASEWDELLRARRPGRGPAEAEYAVETDVPRGLDELHRLLRKEWAARESASPAADPQALRFLAQIVPKLQASGQARLGILRAGGEAIAADLVVTDGARAVQLLRGADPEHLAAGAAVELTRGSLDAAVRGGARRFELADEDSPLRTQVSRVLRLRLWNATAFGRLHRGVTSLKGMVRSAEPGRAFDRLRGAAPDVAKRAVAKVATYATLHLYRGELFTRDVREPGDQVIRLFSRADFDALDERTREAFTTRLDLQAGYCRQKWDRGDTVVLAEVAGRPAGIVWCARTSVYVPDIGREVRPGAGECYIHDVYVHPDERGRQVAPAMLDFLARELRARDVYRAWALIERSNSASTRAFEKAAYASVADVVYARMGLASRLLVRPPDPEARTFLGLP
ncbi:MAG TPA: GNAT family N-acetyltransferase [Polyangia bacterium]|jgi:ribosomal protein S18 acetylase RimI-like enzyme